MYIDQKTAQLILDAIAWENAEWRDLVELDYSDQQIIELSRTDFVRFCRDRGIEGVEVPQKVRVPNVNL